MRGMGRRRPRLAKEYDTDDQQDEQAQNLVHTVLFQECRDAVGHHQHGDARRNDGGSQHPENIRDRQRRQDRIEAEDQVHQDDQGGDLQRRFGAAVALGMA